MILLPTLWQTVRWKHVLFWYTLLTLIFWSYDPSNGPVAIAIVGQMGMTILAIIIIFSVWNKVIYGYGEGFPILWIFSTVVKDIRIFKKTEDERLLQMEHWCNTNCQGKWHHCKHGYFVFRKKTDAMAFKLVWYQV